MKIIIKIPSYREMVKIMIFSIIWYIEFCVRYFQISNALLLLGGALAFFLFLDFFSDGKSSFGRIPRAVWFLFIYEVYTLVFGAVVAPDFSAHVSQGIKMVEYTLVLFAILYYAKTKGSIKFLVWNYAIMCTLMCFIFLYKPIFYHNNPLLGRMSFASSMNPNSFGMLMAMGSWSVLYLASCKKIPMFLAVIISGLEVIAIFQSGSRKGIIGILIIIALWIVLCYIPSTDSNKWHIKILKIAICLCTMITGLFILAPYYMDSNLAGRMAELTKEASGGARNDMYVEGLKYFKKSPLFGYGLQGFSYFYGAYSHATIIEVPVSGGIIGTTLFLAMCIEIFFSIIKKLIHCRNVFDIQSFIRPRMALVLLGSMAFYSIAMIHIYEISSYIYVGLIIALYTLNTTSVFMEDEYED